MVMNKLLKMAGKGDNGTVQGVAVSDNGEVRTVDGAVVTRVDSFSVEAGGVSAYYITKTERPSRVFVFLESGYIDQPYELTIEEAAINTDSNYGIIDNTPHSRTALRDPTLPKPIISSGARELVSGNGQRQRAYTDLTDGTANGIAYQFKNNSTTETMVGKIVVVSYPYEILAVESSLRTTETIQALSLTVEDIKNKIEQPTVRIQEPEYSSTTIEFDGTNNLELLYESDNRTVVEYLEFGCTVQEPVRLAIYAKKSDGTTTDYIGPASLDSGHTAPYSVGSTDLHKGSLFDVYLGEEEGGKLCLNRYLTFPHGVVIYAMTRGAAAKVTLRLYAIRG